MSSEFDILFNDLQTLFMQSEILLSDVDDFSLSLKSKETKKYLHNLVSGSQPEPAFREAFFAGSDAEIFKQIGEKNNPESTLREGFIDYKIGKGRQAILLELKPPFEISNKSINGKSVPTSIKSKPLNWKAHDKQILKYMRQHGEFIILTNLKEWVFFNDMVDPENLQPFLTLTFEEFFKAIEQNKNLQEFLRRRDSEANRDILDKQFFNSLKLWVSLLEKLDFKGLSEEKTRKIIGVINKFIFIQTLDDYEVVDFNWILETWEYNEKKWGAKGSSEKVKKFFDEVNTWFYEYYDTELFTTSIVDFLIEDEANYRKFWNTLKIILGIQYAEEPFGSPKGIIQYNFRFINEDIFGKAYEQYLADVRHDDAIYYTPHYITEHLVELTIGSLFDKKIEEMKLLIEEKNFENIDKLIEKFFNITILDPACGSGSFLVKSFKKIFERYQKLDEFLVNKQNEHSPESGHYNSQESWNILENFRVKLKTKEKKLLIPAILLRHIHGNDVDKSALNVAKVNLWLESIKLAPSSFRYDSLGKSNRILPYLEMNLVSGNALIGLDDSLVIDYILTHKKHELKRLFELREEYLLNPKEPQLIRDLEKLEEGIQMELNEIFFEKLKELNISESLINVDKILHWPLTFFHFYFDRENKLSDEMKGVDCVVGNPPYLDSETMTTTMPIERDYYNNKYTVCKGNWDIFCPFIEKGLNLTKQNGVFGYIVPNKLLSSPYANETCNFIRNYNLTSLRDYSSVKVFDAAVYPITFSILKINYNENSMINIESMEEDENIFPNISAQRDIPQSIIHSLSNNMWGSIFGTQTSMDLHEKIYSKFKKLKEIKDLTTKGAATVSEAYEIKEILREKTPTDENIKLFINTGTIDPYTSLWGIFTTQYIKSQYQQPVVDNNNLENQFPTRYAESNISKIIIASMCKEYEVFYDDKGEYLAGKSTTIIYSDKYNLKSLTAFMNSCIPTFLAKAHKGLELSNGYLNINKGLIEELPIPTNLLIPKNEETNLTQLVDELHILNADKYNFKKYWKTWCEKLSNKELDLFTILDFDYSEISKNQSSNAWSLDATSYPDTGKETFSNSYTSFKLEVDLTELKILIIMDLENSFYIQFRDIESTMHVYLCLSNVINSSKKFSTLKELFEKTIVPLINPNYELNTKNIALNSIDDFIKTKNEKTPSNLIELDDRLDNLITKIDVIILNLFEISLPSEIEFILESTERTNIQKRMILNHFHQT